MSYFNVDWLDEDRLDLSEDLLLDPEGNPIGDIDIDAMMEDYLIPGESFFFDTSSINELLEPGSSYSEHVDMSDLDQYFIGDPSSFVSSGQYIPGDIKVSAEGSDIISGEELWNISGAAGVSNQKRLYNQWKEKNNKLSTIADISKKINEIDSIKRLGALKTGQIENLAGKSGFSGSGTHDAMQEAHYGDVSRTVQGVVGGIKKDILGYTSDVNKSREDYIEDTWDLYTDWLKTDPDKYKAVLEAIPLHEQTNEDGDYVAEEHIQDQFDEDGLDIIDDDGTVPDEVLDPENESWIQATACSMAGGNMAPNGWGGTYCNASDYALYESYLDNYNDCPNTWVDGGGLCNDDIAEMCQEMLAEGNPYAPAECFGG
jgi:hypothetical protein